MTNWTLALYSLAGLCELSGVAVTVLDIRSKGRAWADFIQPSGPTNMREMMIEADAASRGGATYGQLQRINEPISAALSGPWLKVAASLLAAGIVIGTVANALSATH